MNITDQELTKMIDEFFKIDLKDIEIEKNLKILFFQINQEIKRMDKVKERIDSSFNFRFNILLYFLWALLVAQTAWFFYMIYYVDYLGWDLVEPATFLVSSSLFMISIFLFVKMNRNTLSSVRLFEDMKNRFEIKRFAKANFNIKRYEELKKRSVFVKEMIENRRYI